MSSDVGGSALRVSPLDRPGRKVSEDYAGALQSHSLGSVDPEAIGRGFPRDRRQYFGNWTTESIADIYA